MSKFLKIISVILVNVILLCALFFLLDFIVFKYACKDFQRQHPDDNRALHFSYRTDMTSYISDLKHYFNGEGLYLGRLPDGTEYNNKTPVVVFGCSYAYGAYLNSNQTFSYKLAHLLKRPVYNRSAIGWSVQHMLYQTQSDELYNDIPDTDTVIYVMIGDHIRRMQLEHFYIIDNWAYLHYSLKNNRFVLDNYNSKLSNFYRALYIRKLWNHIKAQEYATYNYNKMMKLHSLMFKYIKESKENMEKRLGKKLNFIVIYYEPGNWGIPYKEDLTQMLMADNIKVISTKELTNEDLSLQKYMLKDMCHPSEAAWDLLTPLIAKKLNLTD